jgi:phosphoglycolate phosphatase-like HAD superfamily hydrolase
MTCPYTLVAWDISGTLQDQRTGLLFDGIREILEALKAQNVKLAICTDLGNRRAHAFVEENRIEHLIDSIQHTGMNPFKPSKEMLEMAMIDCAVPVTSQVCMVGDSGCDIALAHAMKSVSIYASYGSFDESVLYEEPHHVADSVESLRKILNI